MRVPQDDPLLGLGVEEMVHGQASPIGAPARGLRTLAAGRQVPRRPGCQRRRYRAARRRRLPGPLPRAGAARSLASWRCAVTAECMFAHESLSAAVGSAAFPSALSASCARVARRAWDWGRTSAAARACPCAAPWRSCPISNRGRTGLSQCSIVAYRWAAPAAAVGRPRTAPWRGRRARRRRGAQACRRRRRRPRGRRRGARAPRRSPRCRSGTRAACRCWTPRRTCASTTPPFARRSGAPRAAPARSAPTRRRHPGTDSEGRAARRAPAARLIRMGRLIRTGRGWSRQGAPDQDTLP